MLIDKYKFYSLFAIFMITGCSQLPVPAAEQSVTETVESKQEPNPEALKHFMDAQLYISQNNFPMAIIELQDALRLDPTEGSIHVSLAESFGTLAK